ncbi:MAG: type II toxin-antitoxin system Phd/YefM family antitoxin [Gaiellaceae bacterium]
MGIRELRDGLTSALRRVESGETIEVTRDGKPVALLAPVRESKLDRLIAEGRVTPPTGPPYLPHRRFKPLPGAKSTTEILQEDRDERF